MEGEANRGFEEVDGVRLAVMEAYRQHAGELSARAVILTRNRDLAQDILQDTFLRFFLTKIRGDGIVNERAWLERVMFSLIKGWRKSFNEQATVSFDDAQSATTEMIEDQNAGMPWFPCMAHGLAPRELECFRLRAEGFDYREIAGAMRIRIGTVGVLLNRAVRKIRLRTSTAA
jgi:RNA polymerase sigma factor (sigma-70 family)